MRTHATGSASADVLYTVTQLADELGITPRAIRFYEAKGLVAPQRAGTTRVYTKRERARMKLILRGKQLGFSLREIRDYLDLYDMDRTRVAQLRMLLTKLRDRIAQLEEQRSALEQALSELRDAEQEAIAILKEKAVKSVG